MPKTSISISDHFDGFISSQIANGRYDTASEVIRAALRLLEVQEMEFQSKQEALRAALIAGENSGDSELQIDDIIALAKQKRQTKHAGV
jgi:antitoxin ParD1/3/4